MQRTGSRLSTLSNKNRRPIGKRGFRGLSPQSSLSLNSSGSGGGDDHSDCGSDYDDDYYYDESDVNCSENTFDENIKAWKKWYKEFSFFDVKNDAKKDNLDGLDVNSLVISVEGKVDGGGVGGSGVKSIESHPSAATTQKIENSSSSLFASSRRLSRKNSDIGVGIVDTSRSSSTARSNNSTNFFGTNYNDNDIGVQEIFQRTKDCMDIQTDLLRESSATTAYSKSSRTSNVQAKLVRGLSTSRSSTARGGSKTSRWNKNKVDFHPEIVLVKPPKRGNVKTNKIQIFEKRGSSSVVNTVSRSSSSTFDYVKNLSKSKSSSNSSAAPLCDVSTISGSESTPDNNRLMFWRRRS